jgi:uncharacterized protein YjiS (DUF1127 family)
LALGAAKLDAYVASQKRPRDGVQEGTAPATVLAIRMTTMNVHMPKEEMALPLPASLSSASWSDAHFASGAAERPTLLQRVGLAAKWLMELPRRRALLDELNTLSDHELADIGLTRSELSRVFDPAFAAQRDAERNVHAM